jgi:hypothetical protein
VIPEHLIRGGFTMGFADGIGFDGGFIWILVIIVLFCCFCGGGFFK